MKTETEPRLGMRTAKIFGAGILLLFLVVLLSQLLNPTGDMKGPIAYLEAPLILLSFLLCVSSTFFSSIPLYARFVTSIGAAVAFGLAFLILIIVSVMIWGVPPTDNWGPY